MPHFSSSSHGPNGARVAVVAAGVVSPLGFGLEETLESLREGKDCISPVKAFAVDRCRCRTAGQVADAPLAEANQYHRHPDAAPSGRSNDDPRSERGNGAGRAISEPELTVMGTTSGGMTFGEQYYRGLEEKRPVIAAHAPR